MAIDKDASTTAVSDICQHIFKEKSSTANAFHFNKNGKPRTNESGVSGDMAETKQVAKICSIILDEYLSATQQFLELFQSCVASHYY